jgi:glyoxylase-like metal-dependent hydrolase (beta-lactamase superfamily II)
MNPTSIEPGVFPTSWYAGGATCHDEPPRFLVHAYNDDFYILRQPACTHYEKPFLYLIFGRDRALLLDTGAGNIDVVGAVDGIVRAWCGRRGRASIDLIVGHTHSDSDHVAGDEQFRGKPGVTLVGLDLSAIRAFYGIATWPDSVTPYDLGNRMLDLTPIPGHESTGIAFYDRRTAILITSDTVYPGRLYVQDQAAFVRSIKRLVTFTRDRPVTYLLGTHIENTSTPFVDYPLGTVDQPDEHDLQLSRAHLLELDAALDTMPRGLVRTVLRDLTIWPA